MENKQTSLASAARRDLGRLRTVAATIVRHGFGELLLKTPLGRRLHSKGDIVVDGATVQGTPAVRFTSMLASLGPTFIKLGQILSMRQDLLPREWTEALATLQDAAPVVPIAQIYESVELALGVSVAEAFATFEDKPIGTASIAQVHFATTHEGERVVVKVQRPGIEGTMRGDLNLLYLGAQVLEASIDELRLVGITDIVVEFERALLRELDFREELGNLMRMRGLLDPKRSVTVPRPYPELSEKTVLTMDFFPGKPLRQLVPGSELAKHAVNEVLHALCKQVFVDGFFHGDPHAGNILCDETGKICLLDLGLVGTLTTDQRSDVISLLVATFANDPSSIARILLKMGTPTQRVSLMELRAEIERIRGKYIQDSNIDSMDSSGFVQEFADAARKFRIKLASEYAILIKSVATVEGIVRNLDPTADIVAIARPYVQHTLVSRFSPGDVLHEVASEMTTLGSLAHRLPTHIDQLLHDFETGNLQIRAVTPTLNRLPWVLQQSASRLSLSMFASVMSLCSAIVIVSALPENRRIALGVALGLLAFGAWTILLIWHFVRGRPLKLAPLLKLFRRK